MISPPGDLAHDDCRCLECCTCRDAQLGGGGAIVVMLSSWLGKVWANRLMERDRVRYAEELEKLRSDLEKSNRLVQADLEKTIFASKTHFETEFKALTAIWQRVVRVRAKMDRLHRLVAFITNHEVSPLQVGESLSLFDAAVKQLIRAVDYQSPFYPTEIFQHLGRLVELALRAGRQVSGSLDQNDWSWDEVRKGKETFDQFCEETETVSNLIRERISKLSVYAGRLVVDYHT